MAGSVARHPFQIGLLLLLLAVAIVLLLVLQFTCSQGEDEAAISSTGGAAETIETGGPPLAPGPGTPAPGGPVTVPDTDGRGVSILLSTGGTATGASDGSVSGEGSAPAAPGSISGQVEGSQGSLLAGIYVYLADGSGKFTGPFAVTDSQGRFSFTQRPPATYKLYFTDPAAAYDPGWYGAQGSPTGTVINLAPGEDINIKHAMAPASNPAAGSITGRVTTPCGTAAPGCVTGVRDVLVLAMSVKLDKGLQLTLMGTAVTDSNGYYRIDNLPAGDYMVSFKPPQDVYAYQWYRDQRSFETAEILPLAPGETIGKVDALLAQGGTIAGIVTGEGEPLNLALVDIYDDSGVIVDSVITGQTGAFESARLPQGHYRIKTRSLSGGYLGEWYNDKQDFSEADAILVLDSQKTGGIQIDLAAESAQVTAVMPPAVAAPGPVADKQSVEEPADEDLDECADRGGEGGGDEGCLDDPLSLPPDEQPAETEPPTADGEANEAGEVAEATC